MYTSSYLCRRAARRKRVLLATFVARALSATKLQSAWRGKMARDSYLRVRCSWLASREIQRLYRGHLGRRATRRRREWQAAGPGAERLKLGLRMIEDTKVCGQGKNAKGKIVTLFSSPPPPTSRFWLWKTTSKYLTRNYSMFFRKHTLNTAGNASIFVFDLPNKCVWANTSRFLTLKHNYH